MSMRKLTLASLAAVVVLGGVSMLVSDVAIAAGPPEAPITEAVTGITSSEAVLNGTLNPHASATIHYYFAFSPEATCTGKRTEGEGELTGGDVRVSTPTINLTPSAKYTVCLVATNAAEESTVGNQVEFETLGLKPVVDSEGISGLTATAVTLEAQVNPENQSSTLCEFRYESAKTPTTSVPCGQSTLEGYGDTLASATVGGLGADETYSYRVIVENATGKTEGPLQTFTTVAPPKVNDQPPAVSTITRTTALVFGTIDTERDPTTTYHVVYVAANEYEPSAADPYRNGASSPSLTVQAGVGDVSVGPQPITGLLAGTTYHYALVATNSAGTTVGPDYTFTTTQGTPPLAVTGGVGNVTSTTATISGSVDPEGLQTSYEFEVGPDAGYGGGEIFGDAGSDAGTETVAVGLDELVPGVTYHYRLVATNEDGTSYGSDQSFTIPTIPSQIVQEAVLPQLATPAIAFPLSGKSVSVTTRSSTNAQKLVRALATCGKKPQRQRSECRRRARAKYGSKAKKKK
jgi:hypothetical protein